MTDQNKDSREQSPEETGAEAAADAAATLENNDDYTMENGYQWKEPPAFDIEHKDNCVCVVKVTIPKSNLNAMLDEIFEEVNDSAQIPGFRRGKAPRKLLEKRLGKYARSNAVERLAEYATQWLADKHEVAPIAPPEIEGLEDAENIATDEDLCYTMTFETAGKCELGAYEGMEIEKPVAELPDSAVDSTIENMRTRFGRYEPLAEGEAAEGDQVIIDFTGTIDGEAFEGNSAENYPYILGSQRFSPEMETAITGAKAGDTVTAEVTFPEDHPSEELSGKTAVFEIKVNEIKRRELPDLDDELAKRLGHDTVDELRESVRARMNENTDTQVRDFMREQARRKLVECCTFELPKTQVERAIDGEYSNMEQRMVEQHVSAEEIEKHREEMKKDAEERGLFMLKSTYALQELAKKEQVEVTESDFEDYAKRMSDEMQQSYEIMKEYLMSDDMRNMMEYQIKDTKALDALLDKASIVLKPIDDEETDTDKNEDDKEKADA